MSDNNQDLKVGMRSFRVFKKSSSNGKITVYIGKRDYLERHNKTDPIDGVILMSPEHVKDRKVFIHLLASFRYGREDLDVLGLTFKKDLYLDFYQVYPITKNENSENEADTKQSLSAMNKLQARLLQKLGPNAYPFHFELPPLSPASVTLQPAPEDFGKPCGVEYELKAYIANSVEDKANKRNCVKLAIRKLTFATPIDLPPPIGEIVKEFRLASGKIRLEGSLDKERYFHSESISVSVNIDNQSNKVIKKIKLQVLQVADIMLFTRAMYKCVVDEIESEKGFPINPDQCGWSKSFSLCPLLSNNRHKRGLALDGKLRHEDTNLACSTVTQGNDNIEDLGIIVSYKVRIKLTLGFGLGDIQLELPFTLTHPNPEETDDCDCTEQSNDQFLFSGEFTEKIMTQAEQDDDIIFEDFARLKLDLKDFENNK